MKLFTLIILFALMVHPKILAQTHILQGQIENAGEGLVFMASYEGDGFTVVDSMETLSGSFYFILDEMYHPGVYRIIFDEEYQGVRSANRFIEFIYNDEDIEIYITRGRNAPLAHFENSVENAVYNEFMVFELQYEDDLGAVYSSLSATQKGDPDHQSAVEMYMELQLNRNLFLDSMTALYPDLYSTRIMNAFRAPVIPGSMSHEERIDTLKSCFFDHVGIDDPLLLYAPVYSFKLIDYLSLFRNNNLSEARQEETFMEAVDRIMVNVSSEPELRSFVVEYMLEGFELLGMEQVQIHIADRYLDESCEADIVELVLSRMEGYKKMSEGVLAPDFLIRDMDGKNHQLSKLPNPYVLVMFWASTCEHCQELVPELHDWYLHENQLDIEVVAISIDTSEAYFNIFTDLLNLEWITTHDPLGWNGKVPGDYFIYATPALFLLDRERTILARPSSYRQFLRAIKKLSL